MGKFIVIEGLDGTGKTTQIKKLAEYLEQKGEKVFITCEPTSEETGKLLRRVLSGEIKLSPWATASLFLTDRINHITKPENGIKALLEQGFTVISDRYYFSTFAYQGCETDLAWAMDMHYSCPEIIRPDLVLFLTMSVDKCLERIRANRPDSAIEIFENRESLTKISNQFNKVLELADERENIVRIDASGTLEQVSLLIQKAVDES